MHIFIIHQCFALLAAGPRPHGSMSSLLCSFVWHGCWCFEREIKLVSVAAKTYMVVGVARTKITLTSWESAWCRGYSWETEVFASWGQCWKSSALFPHWQSLRKGWQIGALVAAFCNWDLRREDLHVDIGCRVFLHGIGSLFPLWNSNVRSPTWLIYQQITSENLWFESFRWNEGLPCYFDENVVNSDSHTEIKPVPLAMYCGFQAQVTMSWYAFECTAGQIKRHRSSHWVGVYFLYNYCKAVLDMDTE